MEPLPIPQTTGQLSQGLAAPQGRFQIDIKGSAGRRKRIGQFPIRKRQRLILLLQQGPHLLRRPRADGVDHHTTPQPRHHQIAKLAREVAMHQHNPGGQGNRSQGP